MKKQQKTLWTFDAETDPFLFDRIPKAFLWCAVSEHGDRVAFWGDDATDRFMEWVLTLSNALLIGHNAGKFDTLLIKPIIHGSMLVVDGRIIKCSPKKGVEIRDSMAILPMALKKLGAKFEIKIEKLERERREIYKAEIMRYCMNDCVVLLEAVQNFYSRAGCRRLTIASQASHELRAIYPDLPKMDDVQHTEFRPYFFGGRVQCFEKGIIEGDFSLYDVNSMYPSVMAFEQHPYGNAYAKTGYSKTSLPDNGAGFFDGVVDTNGAFPVRLKDKTTPYIVGRNIEVHVTMHELLAAIDCGLVQNIRGNMWLPENTTDFSKFILPHFESRKKAKAIGDDGADLYHKLIPNSSYGRFAMSPDGRDEVYFAEEGEDIKSLHEKGYEISDYDLDSERAILKRPVTKPWLFYEDVATGASITGAARARLMRAIAGAERPIYCDTDSLLCEGINEKVGNDLGQWKHELDCDTAAIAGKKLYVLLQDKRPVKQASKGVKACPTEIYEVAAGEVCYIVNDAPIMRLKGTRFQGREIRST